MNFSTPTASLLANALYCHTCHTAPRNAQGTAQSLGCLTTTSAHISKHTVSCHITFTGVQALADNRSRWTQNYLSPLYPPPELRIQIYGNVLSEDTFVAYDQPMPQDPALLRTCRLMRRKSLPIWASHNNLIIEVQDCDISKLARWCALAKRRLPCFYSIDLQGVQHRKNIMVWLRLWLSCECTGFVSNLRQRPQWRNTVSRVFDVAVFDVAERLRDMNKVAWEKAEPILEDVLLAMAALDEAWA